MSFFSFTSPLQRFYKFLLKKVFGSFLTHELDLKQLDVQLSKGTIHLKDLQLNVQMLNDLIPDLPLTFVDARVRSVHISIPWRSLLSSSCVVRMEGWQLLMIPSEQVQHKASSGSFSHHLAQSAVQEVDMQDTELQKSLSSLGRHFRNTPLGSRRNSDASLDPSALDADEAAHERRTAADVRRREKMRREREKRERSEETGADEQTDDDSSAVENDDDTSAGDYSASSNGRADSANEGLKVVASFLEQVVSAIEVEVTDVTIKIQHFHGSGNKQTCLVIKLPWVNFADLNKEHSVDETSASTAAAAQDGDEALRLAMEASLARQKAAQRNLGPKYEYHKAIRFHGFRVELFDELSDLPVESFSAFSPHATTASTLFFNSNNNHTTHNNHEDHESDEANESKENANTIIHGDMNQDCLISLKLKMKDEIGAKLECECFIRSLRALLTPRQLALLMDLMTAIGLSSRQVAVNAQQQAKLDEKFANTTATTDSFSSLSQSQMPATITGAQPLSNPDFNVIESLLNKVGVNDSNPSSLSNSTDQFFEMSLNPGDSTDHPSNAPAEQVLNLWSMETHILHASLTLLQEDDQAYPHDWWLKPHADDTANTSSAATSSSSSSSPSPSSIQCSAHISDIRSNHLYLSLHHTLIKMTQTSRESHIKVCLGSLALEEYLKQYFTPTSSSSPSLKPSQASLSTATFDESQFVGFKSRSILSFFSDNPSSPSSVPFTFSTAPLASSSTSAPIDDFFRSARSLTTPHLQIDIRSTVDLQQRLSDIDDGYFQPDRLVTSRLTLTSQPLNLEMDLGIGTRLKHIINALALPTQYLNLTHTNPLSVSYPFDLNNPHSIQDTAIDMINQIAADQKRRHSIGHDHGTGFGSETRPAFSQTVILAPSINVHILFPANTPSQYQPHPYTVVSTTSPYTDARGILRPEFFSLELSQLSACNETELPPTFNSSSSMTNGVHDLTELMLNFVAMQDTEWIVRFQQAQVFMHMPPPKSIPSFLPGMPLIKQRILTSTYPSPLSQNASAAYFQQLANASYIRILQRAPVVAQSPFQPTSNHESGDCSNTESHSSAATRSLEEMFFDALPSVKWWESDNQTVNASKTARLFKQDAQGNADMSSGGESQPDAAVFESLAINNSSIVVTVQLPVCALHMSKYDFDLFMFLFNIYSEVMEPPLNNPVPAPPDDDAPLDQHTSDTLNHMQPQELPYTHGISGDEYLEPSSHQHIDFPHPSFDPYTSHVHDHSASLYHSFHPGGGTLPHSDSFSSDSSSDSEMFESVVGADSVILPKSHEPFSPNSNPFAHAFMSASQYSNARSQHQAASLLKPSSHRSTSPSSSSSTLIQSQRAKFKPTFVEQEEDDEFPSLPLTSSQNQDMIGSHEHQLLGGGSDSDMSDDDSPHQHDDDVRAASNSDSDDEQHDNQFGLQSMVGLPASQHTAQESDDDESNENVNAGDIFARASRTSHRSQMFQPANMNRSQLPSVNENVASTFHSNPSASMIASSMMASTDDPALFQSFLPAPPSHELGGPQFTVPSISAPPLESSPSIATHSPTISSTSLKPSSPYKHFLSLSLRIQRGSLCFHENPLADTNSQSTKNEPNDSSQPQTFHIDISEIRLFQVSEFEGKPVSYIAIRAGDITAREYRNVILQPHELYQFPSFPFLFKTMGDDHSVSNSTNHINSRSSSDPLYSPVTDPAAFPLLIDENIASVAWKNPVLIMNFVIKLTPHMNHRETQAVINLRALTLQFLPESKWIEKLSNFFIVAPMPASSAVASSAVPRPPPPPVTKDRTSVCLHAYDCSIDYNPTSIAARGIVSIDHVTLTTTIYPDTAAVAFNITVRDASMFVIPKTIKIQFAPCDQLNELSATFLHRVKAVSLFAHLDAIGYARVATMDFLDASIKQHPPPTVPAAASAVPPPPAMSVEVTNGKLTIYTCWDSFQVFTGVMANFVESVQQVQSVEEVEILFPNMPYDHSKSTAVSSYQITKHTPANAQAVNRQTTTKAFTTSHILQAPTDSSSNSSVPTHFVANSKSEGGTVNILSDIDVNAFGKDLGVAQDMGLNATRFIDNYNEQKSAQTAISLALQAAAEREIERARRARAGEDPLLNDRARRSDSNSPPRTRIFHSSPPGTHSQLMPTAKAAPYNPLHEHDQTARWFTPRETVVQNLEDLDKERDAELEREREERRRRRDDKEFKERERTVKPPTLIEDHISLPDEDTVSGRARLKPPPHFPPSCTQIVLLNLSICWRLFGGQDWDITRPVNSQQSHDSNNIDSNMPTTIGGSHGVNIVDTYHPREHGSLPTNPFAHSRSSINSFHNIPLSHHVPSSLGTFQTEYVGNEFHQFNSLPESKLPSSSVSDVPIIPRGYRQTDRMLEVNCSGFNVRFDQFAARQQFASRTVIAVDDIEVQDLVATSPYKYFLCYFSGGSKGRELGSSMIRFELTNVRPNPDREREEIRATLSVLPIRLNVDQDTLEFLIAFFSHSEGVLADEQFEQHNAQSNINPHAFQTDNMQHQQDDDSSSDDDTTTGMVIGPGGGASPLRRHSNPSERHAQVATRQMEYQTYIQTFQIINTIKLCIDWRPHRIDLKGLKGGDWGQMANLFGLENMELDLKSLKVTGCDGWDVVATGMLNHWVQDIVRHQAHRYIAGIQPIRSVVNLGSGVADLIVLPITHFKHQGKLSRGVQRGLASFIKHVSLESVSFAARVAQTAQSVLENVDDVLNVAPEPLPHHAAQQYRAQNARQARKSQAHHDNSDQSRDTKRKQTNISKMANPPHGYKEGLRQAYESLSRGFRVAASQLVVIPRSEYARYGGKGAVKSVVRALPSTVLTPMIGGMEAISKAMMGVASSLEPKTKQEMDEKYKTLAQADRG